MHLSQCDSIIFAFRHRWSIRRLTSIVDDRVDTNIDMHMSSYHPYYVIISLINTYHPINRFSISIQVWECWQLWVLTNLSPNCLHIANGPLCVLFFLLLSCVSCLIGIHTTWNTYCVCMHVLVGYAKQYLPFASTVLLASPMGNKLVL